MFGFPVKWKRNRRDRLSRLAEAIEAIGEQDRKLIEESARVDHLRSRGAVDLHSICRAFVDKVNARLSEAAVLLDPPAPGQCGAIETRLLGASATQAEETSLAVSASEE